LVQRDQVAEHLTIHQREASSGEPNSKQTGVVANRQIGGHSTASIGFAMHVGTGIAYTNSEETYNGVYA
jgi:hypothetical protein